MIGGSSLKPRKMPEINFAERFSKKKCDIDKSIAINNMQRLLEISCHTFVLLLILLITISLTPFCHTFTLHSGGEGQKQAFDGA